MAKTDSRDDSQLMKALQGGEQAAFDTLLNRHRRFVLNVIYKYVRNRDTAEDLAQEVFVRLYQKRDAFQPIARFTTWLYTMTARICLNHVRDEKRQNPAISMQALSTDSRPFEPADTTGVLPATKLSRDEVRNVVWQALEDLPAQQRMALILYRFENLSYQDIAEVMSTTIAAVKSLIFRARSALAIRLEDYQLPE